MAASIPASAIVSVTPGVLGVGGSGLDLVGLILTNGTRVPIGAPVRFASVAAVVNYFGATSTEAALASVYFAGFVGSTIKPAALLFSQYPTAAVPAYLRGGNVSGMTLTQLQGLAGTLTLNIGGNAVTSGNINLTGATSFSNAATIIQAAFSNPAFAVAFDAVSGGFTVISNAAGATSTIDFASGALAASLALTFANGAVTSQGANSAAPATAMTAVIAQTQNFVSFTTTFEPSTADCVAFAQWTDAQGGRFLYAAWDTDPVPTSATDTASLGYQVRQLGYSGTVPIYDTNNGARIAAFLMGALASVDFTRTNGRQTAAFRSGAAVPAGVSNATIAANLIANGYNFYGVYATANAGFNFFYPGQVSGSFLWVDTFVNQVWLNAAFQLSLMQLLTRTGFIPYNADGYASIEAALQPQITAALSFGAIRAGVPLSADQIANVNAAAGRTISDTLATRGWYVLVLPATPQVRAARASPPVYFWYTDGQSVQQIALNSVTAE